MKKFILFSVIAMTGIAAIAGDVTKEEWINMRKKLAEKDGKEFNQKYMENQFEKRDLNKDGIYSVDEQDAYLQAAAKKQVG